MEEFILIHMYIYVSITNKINYKNIRITLIIKKYIKCTYLNTKRNTMARYTYIHIELTDIKYLQP